MRISGQTIVDAAAKPRPAVVAFRDRVEQIIDLSVPTPPAGFVLPGLVDSHTHPLEAGLQKLFVDLRGAGSVAEVKDRLSTRVRDAHEAGMMLGFNLEPDRLTEKRYPSRHELDAAISGIPVLAYRVDGHSAVTNTAGLELLLTKRLGLRIPGTDSDCSGRPNGVLRGQAYEMTSRLFKHRLRPDHVSRALRLAGEQAAEQGVTTVGALVGVEDTTDAEWRVLLDGLAAMAVRAVPFLQTWSLGPPRRFGLKQAGGCLLIDGSLGSRTAAISASYADAAGSDGTLYQADDDVLAFFRAASEADLQTTVHAIGDRAVEQVVRCHEQLAEPGNRLRHRIEHAELLSDSLIDRIARLELILGVQPAFEAEWGGPGRMYAQRLGNRWRCTNRYRSLLDAGVRLAGGSDSPITRIDPVAGIRSATSHPNRDERVSGSEALAMFTSAAAFSLNLEAVCGSIAPGKDSDFTVLTADPRTTADCEVVATFRAGTCTYKNKDLTEYLKLEA